MPRKPNFNERSMYDKPQVVADRPRISRTFASGIEENWRQEIETLMGVDEGVARIVEALRATGELDNTLIVYMSDNGYMHGEHRALAEKVLPYEESIRIPLLMRGPGVPHGRVDRRLVGNLDVTATILDATDVAPGRVLDGRSLLELLDDPGAEWGRDILIENGKGANRVPTYRGIRTYRFLYVEHRTTGEYELYDLEKDPYQLKSVDGHDALREGAARPPLTPAAAHLLRGPGLPRAAAPQADRPLGRPAGARLLDPRPTDSAARLEASPARARGRADRPPPGRAAGEHPHGAPPAHRPDDAHRRGPPQADPPLRPLPPPRARGDGRRPQAHDRPDAAALPLSTRRSARGPYGSPRARPDQPTLVRLAP